MPQSMRRFNGLLESWEKFDVDLYKSAMAHAQSVILRDVSQQRESGCREIVMPANAFDDIYRMCWVLE